MAEIWVIKVIGLGKKYHIRNPIDTRQRAMTTTQKSPPL
jgi:hypothetical protein